MSFATVQSLDRLWGEVRAKPLWAPPNLWRYVKLRWRAHLELLDPARVRLAAPPGKVNDCAACTDNCCIGPRAAVLLRLRDIATLVDLGREELVSLAKPTFSSDELATRPALARQVDSRAWQVFPVLAQNRFHACRALTEDGRCSLYPHWPLSCARFPYALHLDSREVFYSRRCDAYWIRNDGAAGARVEVMKRAAVAAYNERVKDLVLLEYARPALEALGLTRFLRPDHGTLAHRGVVG